MNCRHKSEQITDHATGSRRVWLTMPGIPGAGGWAGEDRPGTSACLLTPLPWMLYGNQVLAMDSCERFEAK
jgi:hypothetical protein